MKKFYTLIAISVFALSLNAQTPDFIVEKIAGAPTLDGVAEELWDDLTAYEMPSLTDDGASLEAASFKLAWNDTALFILVKVTDNEAVLSPMDRGGYSNDNWKTDRTELYLSGNPVSIENQAGAGYAIYNGANVPGGEYPSGTCQVANRIPLGSDTTITLPEQIVYKVSTHKEGTKYTSEFSVAWEYLVDSTGARSIMAEPEQMFLFDVSINDVDEVDPDGTRHFIRYKNPSPWDAMNVSETAIAKLVSNLTAINSTTLNDVEVYPNPANDNITIKNVNFNEARVLNIMGQEVMHLTDINDNKISISELNTGIYFLSIQNDNELLGTVKFVKN